ncbi:unnamed protein product [Rotaria socialis]|uniref:Multidrug resistance-associated protein 4 n=1 Tax=Rotaria socialis TaxID=392032 RepID=A0A821IAP9_9BILA|nr:unnamed protein product [Rotaria socialis]
MTTMSSNPNPYLRANRLSRFFHSWLSELLSKSYQQQTLHLSDLYDLLPHMESTKLTDQMEANWLDELNRYKQKQKQPSLLRATLRTVGWKPLLVGLLLIPIELSKIAQPIVLIFLMNFFESCSTMPIWGAWLLTAATILASLCTSLIYNPYFYWMQIFGLKMRVAYSGLIYRKLLRLSSDSMNKISPGKITNLLSNDASQIELVLQFINNLWIAPLEIIIVIIIFWQFVKYIAFIAVGYTLLLLSIQLGFGRFFLHLRGKIMQVTDERVKMMSETIQSMSIVKMYCWESAFAKKILSVRRREIIQYAFSLVLECIQTFFASTYTDVAFFIMYTAMWSLNIRFNTRFFAIAAGLLGFMRLSIIEFVYYAIRYFVFYMAAQKRIQAFLLLSESERDNRLMSICATDLFTQLYGTKGEALPEPVKVPSKGLGLQCNLKRATWKKDDFFQLRNIAFDAKPGDLICVIGAVGSGKSSFLQTLSGEIPYFDGKVRLYGSFCYVPQEPWIFSSSILNNILFGKEYNRHLFQRVVYAAALESDLNQLPHGRNTIVGDQGFTLSGGQKARINLARALYRDADIYLLDDPLSALDAQVSKHLFEKTIKGYLRNKICILATHQVQFLQEATKIIVLKYGETIEMGTYNKLLATSTSFSRLIDDIHQNQEEKQQEFIARSRRQSMLGTQSSEKDEEEMLSPVENDELIKEGSVKWTVYTDYLRAGIGLFLGFLLAIGVFSAHQGVSIFSNWWLAKWSDEETYRYYTFNNCTTMNAMNNEILNMTDAEWNKHRNQRFIIYCAILFVVALITLLRVVATKFMCLNAGRVLHDKMLQRIIRCPINFFDMNPLGRIFNRFTKDVMIMDDSLPSYFFDCLQGFFQILGTVALVGWLNPWSLIPTAIAAACLLFVRYRFAQCSRDLKRLEGVTRSPVYSHLVSTTKGLKIIRSYHAEYLSSEIFFHHLDVNTRANYLLITVNRWSAFRFDWIALGFIALVTMLAVILRMTRNSFSSADIALTLSYSLNLMSLLQWTIKQSVNLETQMTAVERVLEYCNLEQEPPAEVPVDQRPPSDWPRHGRIVFDDVSMSQTFDTKAPLILSHLSFTIEAAEKIGIVGRTGAGKSSLIQTLFRMNTLLDGEIKIDDINIATIGLNDLRRQISIIPQNPFLFTGTMRSNLDQFDEFADTEIWDALEQVQLKKFVAENLQDGLHSIMTESGSNLSVGQKQLMCLARAILRKSKILLVDEATANVDMATDKLIQMAIRSNFKDCTVLTVAHRLRTIIDSDRVMVLQNGKLLEFDRPYHLIRNPYSHFTSLVEQTGSGEAEHLRNMAENSFSDDIEIETIDSDTTHL